MALAELSETVGRLETAVAVSRAEVTEVAMAGVAAAMAEVVTAGSAERCQCLDRPGVTAVGVEHWEAWAVREDGLARAERVEVTLAEVALRR